MEIASLVALSALLTICCLTILISYIKSIKNLNNIQCELSELRANYTINEQEEIEYKKKNNDLEIKYNDLLIKKTEAETKLKSLQENITKYEQQLIDLKREATLSSEEKNKQQREKELALQRERTALEELQNFEETNKKNMQMVKASIFEAGTNLSNKLLDDHKRESISAKKENEKVILETTSELQNKFQNVFETMNHLHENVKKSNKDYEVINRSLLSPTGAGTLGEITLENILKNSGLTEGLDYKTQYNFKNNEGQNLRPDAVVFIPDNNVMVIDSKSSKFFLELGDKNLTSEQQSQLKTGLKKSMNENLKGLASREYSKIIEQEVGKSLAHVYMFLPTESALEQIRKIDATFIDRAWGQGIFPVGPTGLVNELLRTNMQIANAKQEENTKVIIERVKDLLNGIAVLNTHANGIGKNLKSSLDKYDKFAASFNSNFMSKARKISKLGVNSTKIEEIEPLQKYVVNTLNIKELEADIEQNADTEEENVKLELLG